jgi:hypothetical protein
LKKQYFFSFVLATLSFIAAKSLQKVGVDNYYYEKATTFLKEDGYLNLAQSDQISLLPMGIESFSDIAFLDSTILICLQEDKSSLVLFDLSSNQVSTPITINLPNKIIDFSRIDSTIILLDDQVQVHFLLPPYDSSSLVTENDILGNWKSAATCIHESTKRMFILTQNNLEIDNPISNSIYTYTISKRKLNEKALFDISISDLEMFAIENNIATPQNKFTDLSDSLSQLIFNPTAMAIHPKTNEIYILSSENRSIVVFNQFGEVQNLIFLDEKLVSNPKAMTFHPSGDLLISNSDLMSPAIVRLKWNKIFQSKNRFELVPIR